MKWKIIACIACLCVFLSACGNSNNQENNQHNNDSTSTIQNEEIGTSQNVGSSRPQKDTVNVNDIISKPFIVLSLNDTEKYSITAWDVPAEQKSITDYFTKEVCVGDIEYLDFQYLSSIPSEVREYIDSKGGYSIEISYNNCEPYFEDIPTLREVSLSKGEQENYIYFPNQGQAEVTIKYGFNQVFHNIKLNFNVSVPNINVEIGNSPTNNKVAITDNNTVFFTGIGYQDNYRTYKNDLFYINEYSIENNLWVDDLENYCIENAKSIDGLIADESICSIGNKVYYTDRNALYMIQENDNQFTAPKQIYSTPKDGGVPRFIFSIGDNICILYDQIGYAEGKKVIKGSDLYLIDELGTLLSKSIHFSEIYNMNYYEGNLYVSGILENQNPQLYRADINLQKFKSVEPNSLMYEDEIPYYQFFIVDGYTYYLDPYSISLYSYKHYSGEEGKQLTPFSAKAKTANVAFYSNVFYYVQTSDRSEKYANNFFLYKYDLNSGENAFIGKVKWLANIGVPSVTEMLDTTVNICGNYLYVIPMRGLLESNNCSIYRLKLVDGAEMQRMGIYN